MNKQTRAERPQLAQSHHTTLTVFSSFPSKPVKLCHGGNEGFTLSLFASLSFGIPNKEAVLYTELGLCVFMWLWGPAEGLFIHFRNVETEDATQRSPIYECCFIVASQKGHTRKCVWLFEHKTAGSLNVNL